MLSRWFRGLAARKIQKSRSKSGKHAGSVRGIKKKPLKLEWLEARDLLSTVTWINPGNGNWNVAANWSGGEVPGTGDDVIIDTAAALTVTIPANRF
jgi:hypothetical protein